MIELRWLQPTPPDEPILMGLLDEAERARASRFYHRDDRLAYAAAHALLRTLLSALGDAAPQDWRFIRAPAGKPRLDETRGWPDLRFSLSHTRGMVACAVAAGVDLGVDVEPLTPVPDALIMACAHFSAREAEGLQALAEPSRSEAFVHLWTLKEAAHKASGAGLQAGLEHPSFDPTLIMSAGDAPSPTPPGGWTFRRYLRGDGFVLALALPSGDGPLRVRCRRAAVQADRLHPTASAHGFRVRSARLNLR